MKVRVVTLLSELANLIILITGLALYVDLCT